MTKEEKLEKAKKLRPLKIILTILVIILFVLILDRLPTSRNQIDQFSAGNNKIQRTQAEGKEYYHLTGFLYTIEDNIELKLREMGVPTEEFKNASEYFSKVEIAEIEAKITLASQLEESIVEVDEEDKKTIREIFGLNPNYSFEKFQKYETPPSEYKILTDLINDYKNAIKSNDNE